MDFVKHECGVAMVRLASNLHVHPTNMAICYVMAFWFILDQTCISFSIWLHYLVML